MRKLNSKGYQALVPLVLAVIIVFALLFAGSYIAGTIHTELEDQYPTTTGDRTQQQNSSIRTMTNISTNMDSTLDIVQVVIIITILAAAIGAIFLFTRFR